jgi:competence protein ComEC
VGAQNRYGHPAAATLARLAAHRVDCWRTDRDGTISVTTDGHRMTVRGGGRTATYDIQ